MIENDANIWYKLASDIENNVTEAYERLFSLSDETSGVRPNPVKDHLQQISELIGDSIIAES